MSLEKSAPGHSIGDAPRVVDPSSTKVFLRIARFCADFRESLVTMDAFQVEAIQRGVEVMKAAQDGTGVSAESFHTIARDDSLEGLVQTAYGLANVCSYLLMTRQCEERVSAADTLRTLGAMAASVGPGHPGRQSELSSA